MIYAILDTLNYSEKIELFKKGKKIKTNELPRTFIYCTAAVGIMFILIMIVNFICSPVFNAKSYQTRISIDQSGNFTEDI